MKNPYQKGGLLYIEDGIDVNEVQKIIKNNEKVVELLKEYCSISVYRNKLNSDVIRFDNGRTGLSEWTVDVLRNREYMTEEKL